MISHCHNYDCSYFEIDPNDNDGFARLFELIKVLSIVHYNSTK